MTKYLEEQNIKDSKLYPELKDQKERNYYLFEMKTDPYLKNEEKAEYKRTARVDKKLYGIVKILQTSEKLFQT